MTPKEWGELPEEDRAYLESASVHVMQDEQDRVDAFVQ